MKNLCPHCGQQPRWHSAAACDGYRKVALRLRTGVIDTCHGSFLAVFSFAKALGLPTLRDPPLGVRLADVQPHLDPGCVGAVIDRLTAVEGPADMPEAWRRTRAMRSYAQAYAVTAIARMLRPETPLFEVEEARMREVDAHMAALIADRYQGIVGWLTQRAPVVSGTARFAPEGRELRTIAPRPPGHVTARPNGHRGAYRFVGHRRFETIDVYCPDDPWLDAAFREQTMEDARTRGAAARGER